MSFAPKLQRKAAAKVLAYLRDTYRNRSAFLKAVDEFRLAMLNLAANPRQAIAPPGLFETRPIFRFVLRADGLPREMQVCFRYDPDDPAERTIEITDFMPVDEGEPPV
jgi:hypothetical protein